ncbi:MAG: hypothetical protein IJ793_00810 [Opitutales bacterium]|nr:hypothetical protein [Opitutales bacterium]
METFKQQDPSSLLAFLQVLGEIDETQSGASIIDRILENQTRWQSFIEQQKQHCQKSMQLFRFYDTKNKLKSLWIRLQLGKYHPNKKELTLLNEYATQAKESGNLEDAFHMFSFMALMCPRNYVLYLKVCEVCDQLHGIEAAVQLYEMTARLFEEPNVLFLAAECEARCGHWEQAKTYVTQALAIFEQRPPSTPQEMEFKADLKELSELVEKACA